MKIRKYINRPVDGIKISVVMLCCALFWSCSFDEPLDEVSTTSLDDDNTYLAVELTDDGQPLLVASNLQSDNKVYNVHFYFYDGDGNYITKGEIDPDESDWEDGSGNVELQTASGTKLLILEGLTATDYPKYVVTVVNQPSTFEYSDKLEGMLDIKSEGSNSGIGSTTAEEGLVMSTSTYIPASVPYLGSAYQFYTEISSDNFSEDVATAAKKPLTIPVERLAAKVTVNVGISTSVNYLWSTEDGGDGETHFLYNIEGNVYVEFEGWKINAVARDSYIFKNLKDSWASEAPGVSWSDWNMPDGKYYCQWAESYYYDEGSSSDYPDNNDGNLSSENESSLCPYVKYVNLEDEAGSRLISMNSSDYCPENTNTVGAEGIWTDTSSTGITSVLIKAKRWTYDATTEVGTPDTYDMYYNIPIHHVHYTDGSTFNEGDYGVVRNFRYTVNITSVEGVGTTITNPDAVIVPHEVNGEISPVSYEWSHEKQKIKQGGDEDFIYDATQD